MNRRIVFFTMHQMMIVFLFLTFGVCTNLQAQQSKRRSTESVQKVRQPKPSKAIKTDYSWIDTYGDKYPIYITSKSCFVMRKCRKCRCNKSYILYRL